MHAVVGGSGQSIHFYSWFTFKLCFSCFEIFHRIYHLKESACSNVYLLLPLILHQQTLYKVKSLTLAHEHFMEFNPMSRLSSIQSCHVKYTD